MKIPVLVATSLAIPSLVLGVRARAETAAVDPQMQSVLGAMQTLGPKPLETLSAADARKQPSAKDAAMAVLKKKGMSVKSERVLKVRDTTVPGDKGPIAARVYTPLGSGPFPVIVYFHGGGFVVADMDTYDASSRGLSNQARAVVVSVNYRQAPENPYRAAADDALAAFRNVQKNAKTAVSARSAQASFEWPTHGNPPALPGDALVSSSTANRFRRTMVLVARGVFDRAM
jgi:acetyl esterase/lipase